MDSKEIKEAIGEVYKVRNKIENVDSHSELFKKYCIVSMILMGIVTIVALCTKVPGVPILSGIFILIFALFFWANNREHKKVRIDIGRGLPVIMGMLQVMVIVALIGSLFLRSKMNF